MSGRHGAAAAISGGALWLLLWSHQLLAHGTTEENEKKLVLGLTWMDSAKLFVASFVLFLVAVVAADRVAGPSTTFGRAAFWFTAGALVASGAATAVEFWPFPWASYDGGYDEPHARYGGIVRAVASLVLTVGLVLFAIHLTRTRVLPWWGGVVLVLGGPTTIFLSPAFPMPGLAWLVVGIVLLARADRSPPLAVQQAAGGGTSVSGARK